MVMMPLISIVHILQEVIMKVRQKILNIIYVQSYRKQPLNSILLPNVVRKITTTVRQVSWLKVAMSLMANMKQ